MLAYAILYKHYLTTSLNGRDCNRKHITITPLLKLWIGATVLQSNVASNRKHITFGLPTGATTKIDSTENNDIISTWCLFGTFQTNVSK